VTRAPRAAPYTASASAKQFASFANTIAPSASIAGKRAPTALRRSLRNGRPFDDMLVTGLAPGRDPPARNETRRLRLENDDHGLGLRTAEVHSESQRRIH
jgi:hypothetical protein